ncbi:hypothetical protein Tsubulata_001740 [Turnera subulata]|uniref:Fungal lipase-type domain-containing protein n=1 Tax=Turnera subulata TaxID=218843 RepID=A0A9Q0G418_9ROSI|nr:hypothetical protein Tsubulata_001740 [Turnera subulata]
MAYRNDEHFCNNKLLLEAKDASSLELVRLLFSSDIKNRRFIDCSEEHRDFNRRWLIFISVLLQRIVLSLRKPMAFTGQGIEMWLNMLSSNGGFFALLLNLLRGKLVKPDPKSSTFTSFVGNLDTRVELDKNIRVGHRRYITSLSLMAAKLAYENEAFISSIIRDHWKMEFKGFYNFWNGYLEQPSTKAFMLQDSKSDPNLIVVAFRGTVPYDAYGWCTDIDLSWYELEGVGKIHRGFMEALGLQKNGWPNDIDQGSDRSYAYYALRQTLKDILQKNEKAKLIVTGHSLGAALAILFVSVLAIHEEAFLLDRLEGVYTFGQPRVGDRQFGEFMKDKLKRYDVRYLRYVYSSDIVPRLPYDDKTLLFKHFGPCLFYNCFYKGKVMPEEPNRNYFSLWWFIPQRFTAAWELVRSFIIPIINGRDYRETWLMTLMRMIGLAIPGLSAHCLQNYDNSARFGSLPLSVQLQDSHQELHHD